MKPQRMLIACALMAPLFSSAQNDADVFRYTQLQPLGTARFSAMSGSFGALGADLSSVTVNPAGLALFRRSEASIGFGIVGETAIGKFTGTESRSSATNGNLNHWGLGFALKKGKDDDLPEWKFINFSVGYNRQNRFTSNQVIQGTLKGQTLIDDLVNRAQGKDPGAMDPFLEGLAFNAYLFDPDTTKAGNYYTSNWSRIPSKTLKKTIDQGGGMGETNISIAGNYANKWFLGASIGFSRISFFNNETHGELTSDSGYVLKSFSYVNSYATQGWGANLRLGVLYMPAPWIRLGVSGQTGTRYQLQDNYNSTMEVVFANSTKNYNSPEGAYRYTLRTPGWLTSSIALMWNKLGAINIDYQIQDYSNGALYPGGDFVDQNALISAKYKLAQTVRVGAELKLEWLSIRGGWSYQTSPFINNDTEYSRQGFTAGAGFRRNGFFADFAYVHSRQSSNLYLFDASMNAVPATIQRNTGFFQASVGVKF